MDDPLRDLPNYARQTQWQENRCRPSKIVSFSFGADLGVTNLSKTETQS